MSGFLNKSIFCINLFYLTLWAEHWLAKRNFKLLWIFQISSDWLDFLFRRKIFIFHWKIFLFSVDSPFCIVYFFIYSSHVGTGDETRFLQRKHAQKSVLHVIRINQFKYCANYQYKWCGLTSHVCGTWRCVKCARCQRHQKGM